MPQLAASHQPALLRRIRWLSLYTTMLAATMTLVGCAGANSEAPGEDSGASDADSKLIIAAVGFPCGLNDFAGQMCEGFAAGEAALPEGYRLELKTGIDFTDNVAFNSLIQTSLQLNPEGMIVFPGGEAAQVPVLKQACVDDVRIVIIDNPVEGLGDCQDGFIAADNQQLGVNLGTWLINHPPTSNEVGIVGLQPGQYASNDARVDAFTETVENAGFEIAATVATDLSLDKTRTQVTNMLTAHPEIGTVFSAADFIGDAVAQAVGDQEIVQLSIDGSISSVKRILTGGLDANQTQAPFFMGEQAVLNMAKAIEGEQLPPVIHQPTETVDKTNVEEYISRRGTH